MASMVWPTSVVPVPAAKIEAVFSLLAQPQVTTALRQQEIPQWMFDRAPLLLMRLAHPFSDQCSRSPIFASPFAPKSGPMSR